MALYEIAVLGLPAEHQKSELSNCISQMIKPFGLCLGDEFSLTTADANFRSSQRTPAVIAFFGAADIAEEGLEALRRTGIPILPIVSAEGRFATEVPLQLQALNGLAYSPNKPERIAAALLESLGLLPRQRRVFLSYRREEARQAALQLFDSLSARVFDVFLDTHRVGSAEDFQAVLWHRLCDSDVLVMLDTTSYFDSRWTSAEFGRALAKGISVLRVGWPSVVASPRASTASRVDLDVKDIDASSGRLTDDAVDRICRQLELVRAQSHAIRHLNLFSKIKQGVECIGGSIIGVGIHNAAHVALPDKREVVIYPVVGVPTSMTLNDAIDQADGRAAGVAYDHIGLDKRWVEHLEWLGENIKSAHWVRATEAAWIFAGWGLP